MLSFELMTFVLNQFCVSYAWYVRTDSLESTSNYFLLCKLQVTHVLRSWVRVPELVK